MNGKDDYPPLGRLNSFGPGGDAGAGQRALPPFLLRPNSNPNADLFFAPRPLSIGQLDMQRYHSIFPDDDELNDAEFSFPPAPSDRRPYSFQAASPNARLVEESGLLALAAASDRESRSAGAGAVYAGQPSASSSSSSPPPPQQQLQLPRSGGGASSSRPARPTQAASAAAAAAAASSAGVPGMSGASGTSDSVVPAQVLGELLARQRELGKEGEYFAQRTGHVRRLLPCEPRLCTDAGGDASDAGRPGGWVRLASFALSTWVPEGAYSVVLVPPEPMPASYLEVWIETHRSRTGTTHAWESRCRPAFEFSPEIFFASSFELDLAGPGEARFVFEIESSNKEPFPIRAQVPAKTQPLDPRLSLQSRDLYVVNVWMLPPSTPGSVAGMTLSAAAAANAAVAAAAAVHAATGSRASSASLAAATLAAAALNSPGASARAWADPTLWRAELVRFNGRQRDTGFHRRLPPYHHRVHWGQQRLLDFYQKLLSEEPGAQLRRKLEQRPEAPGQVAELNSVQSLLLSHCYRVLERSDQRWRDAVTDMAWPLSFEVASREFVHRSLFEALPDAGAGQSVRVRAHVNAADLLQGGLSSFEADGLFPRLAALHGRHVDVLLVIPRDLLSGSSVHSAALAGALRKVAPDVLGSCWVMADEDARTTPGCRVGDTALYGTVAVVEYYFPRPGVPIPTGHLVLVDRAVIKREADIWNNLLKRSERVSPRLLERLEKSRPGAGAPQGSSVLDAIRVEDVAAECRSVLDRFGLDLEGQKRVLEALEASLPGARPDRKASGEQGNVPPLLRIRSEVQLRPEVAAVADDEDTEDGAGAAAAAERPAKRSRRGRSGSSARSN